MPTTRRFAARPRDQPGGEGLAARLASSLPCTGVVLQAPTSEAVKCQAVVDALSTHLSPHVTLEHIQGPDLAAHDTMALKNLLDIFSVLFHLPAADEEGESSYGELSEADDSNIISTQGRYNLPMSVHSQRSLVRRLSCLVYSLSLQVPTP